MIAWKASIGNCQWLPFVFVCRLLNTAKFVACFYNCWKPLLGVFYTRGTLRGFSGFAEKAPAVGFLFKQSFEKRLRRGCFFRGFCEVFGSICLVEQERLLLYCFGTTIIINILSSIVGPRVCWGFFTWFFYFYYLLLTILNYGAHSMPKTFE